MPTTEKDLQTGCSDTDGGVTAPSYMRVLRALCRSITSCEAIRVKGKHEGYRCKATYSLLPQLQVSPLSMPRVNEIAAAVGVFCTTRSRLSALAPDFFFEVCVKVSRDDQYMVKLSLLNQRLDCDSIRAAAAATTPESSCSCSRLCRGTVASALSVPCVLSNSGGSSNGDAGTTETLFDLWRRSSEPHALEDHLRAVHPHLVALVAHVCQPSSSPSLAASSVTPTKDLLHRKPDKGSAYVPLTRDGADAMVEYTPNGHAFWLSADSFCEVNHDMETAIYEAILDFLRLSSGRATSVECLLSDRSAVPTSGAESRCACDTSASAPDVGNAETPLSTIVAALPYRRVFICGRDVNSVVRTFEEYYDATTVVTTCPCVYADTKRNNMAHCIRCTKDKIANPLRAFATGKEGASDGERPTRCVRSSGSPVESHCLITAGRHGLHPSTTTALMELGAAARLSDLIYVSCNVESLTRDVHVLKETWYVAHARTFDFFPGTDYVMTVLHLRPLASCDVCGRGGDLLVLPVGLPGTGKSTCGQALENFFARPFYGEESKAGKVKSKKSPSSLSASSPSSVLASPPSAQKKAQQEDAATSPACFVPRSFLSLPQQTLCFRHVERDQVFHEKKLHTGLKAAKQQTHAVLLSALGVWAEGEKDERLNRETWTNDVTTSPTPCLSQRRRVLYLDSTNGSQEARALYHSLWHVSSLQTHLRDRECWRSERDGQLTVPCTVSCLVLLFDAPADASELLRRLQRRRLHPSFPSTEEEQRRKLNVLTAALSNSSNGNSEEGGVGNDVTTACWHVQACAKGNAAVETVEEVVLTVCAHLLFSRELVTLLRGDALQRLRRDVN